MHQRVSANTPACVGQRSCLCCESQRGVFSPIVSPAFCHQIGHLAAFSLPWDVRLLKFCVADLFAKNRKKRRNKRLNTFQTRLLRPKKGIFEASCDVWAPRQVSQIHYKSLLYRELNGWLILLLSQITNHSYFLRGYPHLSLICIIYYIYLIINKL